MMGKRVNYAARSVISPDPRLLPREVGIPPYFAVRLSVPERVTEANAKEMRKAVRNGARQHPGALAVACGGVDAGEGARPTTFGPLAAGRHARASLGGLVMTALTIEVPASVVAKARRHFEETGCPLLMRDARRKTDWPLLAIPSRIGYLLLLGPGTPPVQVAMAMTQMAAGPMDDDWILGRLVTGAVAALAEVPRKFECSGRVVGLWEDSDGSVCVRGPVALTCLSWTLRERKTGVYLKMSVLEGD